MTQNNRIAQKDNTAKLLYNGATAIVIPMNLPEEYDSVILGDGCLAKAMKYQDCPYPHLAYIIEPPFQLGKPLYLLETYVKQYVWDGNGSYQIIYKADNPDIFIKNYNPRWRSPATMPNKACRHVWKNWTVKAVQVKNLSPKMMVKCGMDNHWCELGGMPDCDEIEKEFNDYFTETYPHSKLDAWVWLVEKQ